MKRSGGIISGHIYSCSVDVNRNKMLSIVVVLVLVRAAGGIFSCEPCHCYVSTGEGLPYKHVAACVVMGLSSFPSTLSNHTQVLYIDWAKIPVTKENQFVEFPELQFLRIRNSQVSKIEVHTFRNLTHVTEIDLAYNLITELPADLFLDTPSLVQLSLEWNQLKILPKNIFSNLKHLKTVNLGSNQIVSIVAKCFENVPQLEKLSLRNNTLNTLSMNIFDNSSCLKYIWLEMNPWHCDESLCAVMAVVMNRGLWKDTWSIPVCATPQSLQGKWWSELKDYAFLQQYTCSLCRLEEPSVARCTTSISTTRCSTQLSTTRCSTLLSTESTLDTLPSHITHLHVTDQQFATLNNSTFSSYVLLQELHLERNQIHNIEPNAFLNLTILSELYLSYNELQELPKNIFSPTTNLVKISLFSNNLTRLNKFQFSNLVMLKEVDLSYNTITFIEEKCFINVSSLRTINLSNNQLQTLQLNVMDSAMGLKRLYLHGNPWRCDEALCGVIDAVVARDLWGSPGAIPTCVMPPPLARKFWTELPQLFHPDILILDSNKNWMKADNNTSVQAAQNVTLQCRYCFASRVTWTLYRGERSWQLTSEKELNSILTLNSVKKLDEGTYVCQVSQCSWCDSPRLQLTVNMYFPDTQQECGEMTSEGVTYVVNGTNSNKGEFPWHIALYRRLGDKHEYQCGGSIINPRIILTAAHCLTDEKAVRYPDEEFYIAAGKYYSDYNSVEDKFAQKQQVKEYYIPKEYKGFDSSYAGDLAVVVVKKAFRMTPAVQPVCMDWNGTMESEHLQHNQTGSVVGWGYVDPNNPKASGALKRLDPPFIDRHQCLNEFPSTFRRWVTLDKFCAGFRTGASVCQGDSGGGLVFRWNNTQRYVIRGLVSVGPKLKGACDDSQYGVYTSISFYNTFISNIIYANPIEN